MSCYVVTVVFDERRSYPDVATDDHAVRNHGSVSGLGKSLYPFLSPPLNCLVFYAMNFFVI